MTKQDKADLHLAAIGMITIFISFTMKVLQGISLDLLDATLLLFAIWLIFSKRKVWKQNK